MTCEHCGKIIRTSLYLNKNGKRLTATFCSYKHYLAFWESCKNFEPLKEYIPSRKKINIMQKLGLRK